MSTFQMYPISQESLVKLLKSLFLVLGFMVAATVLTSAVSTKFESLRNLGTPGVEFASAQDRLKQLDCLSKNIYHEAASEPFEGKVAVAQVTLNRVASGKYAPSVCGVVFQRGFIMEKLVCQFSWSCIPTVGVKPIHAELFKESEEVAKKVLLENFRLPSMKDAMFYHADYVNPGWRKPKIAQIGHHIFYKEQS